MFNETHLILEFSPDILSWYILSYWANSYVAIPVTCTAVAQLWALPGQQLCTRRRSRATRNQWEMASMCSSQQPQRSLYHCVKLYWNVSSSLCLWDFILLRSWWYSVVSLQFYDNYKNIISMQIGSQSRNVAVHCMIRLYHMYIFGCIYMYCIYADIFGFVTHSKRFLLFIIIFHLFDPYYHISSH